MDWLHMDLDEDEEFQLVENIKLIHSIVIPSRIAKLPKYNG